MPHFDTPAAITLASIASMSMFLLVMAIVMPS
jgi:hypothetical protein